MSSELVMELFQFFFDANAQSQFGTIIIPKFHVAEADCNHGWSQTHSIVQVIANDIERNPFVMGSLQ